MDAPCFRIDANEPLLLSMLPFHKYGGFIRPSAGPIIAIKVFINTGFFEWNPVWMFYYLFIFFNIYTNCEPNGANK